MNSEVREILTALKDGQLSVEDAAQKLKIQPFEDLGYANIDHHRKIRQGAAEVIYGASKTAEQMIGIVSAMKSSGQKTILITRLSAESAEVIRRTHSDLTYYNDGRVGAAGAVALFPFSTVCVCRTVPS